MPQTFTAQVQQQHKLDALEQASRELAGLQIDKLAEMSVEERIELLKQNIRRLTKDLLHYDVIEIRLLRHETGELVPLLAEGMLEEAAKRVSAPGRKATASPASWPTPAKATCAPTPPSILSTWKVPRARQLFDRGPDPGRQGDRTFNVESPQANGFTELDVQFTEIFCREVAAALHTLELLTAEKATATTQSIEAVNPRWPCRSMKFSRRPRPLRTLDRP